MSRNKLNSLSQAKLKLSNPKENLNKSAIISHGQPTLTAKDPEDHSPYKDNSQGSLKKQVTFKGSGSPGPSGSFNSILNRNPATETGQMIINSAMIEKNYLDQARLYNMNKAQQLKVMSEEDEWAKIQKLEHQRNQAAQLEERSHYKKQQEYLKEYLNKQVEEKKRKEMLRKQEQQHDLIDLVGSLRQDVSKTEFEKSQHLKKKILEQEFKNEGLFLEKAKKEYQKTIENMEKNYETSLPFDKKKDYELLQKKEQERMNGIDVQQLINQKNSQKFLQQLEEKQHSDQPFLDRLMQKNFKLYKNEYESRRRNQELCENIYRTAHLNDKTMHMLSFEDEMRAKQHQNIQLERQKYYDSLVQQKKDRDLSDQRTWSDYYKTERKTKSDVEKLAKDLEKRVADQRITEFKTEEQIRVAERKERQRKYQQEIAMQVLEKQAKTFIENTKLNDREFGINMKYLKS